MKQSWTYWHRYDKEPPEADARVKNPTLPGGAFSILLDSLHRLEDRRLSAPIPTMSSSILFRINGMEARRMAGRQQLCIGTDDGQPQRLEFQSQRQMQDLW